MGKDRQEKKLKASRRVESDRDDSIHHKGATSLEQNGNSEKKIVKNRKRHAGSHAF
ncbi:YpzI family protein [Bacillus velezensis]|nr:YpzI family protein [Bacillus velezensis]